MCHEVQAKPSTAQYAAEKHANPKREGDSIVFGIELLTED